MNGIQYKSRNNQIISKILQREAKINQPYNNRLPSLNLSVPTQRNQIQKNQPYKQFRLTRYKNESKILGNELLNIKKKQLTFTTLNTLEETI
ncbi:unnamed protein product [Paramecium sonneborni]|uniref:Uncharacterized protein n=1 Tax=Paramecium sonneborni TaxID=65129 RepID=A0A8S1R215_9CILI|nr:unnamed protein product [Paramecium sonneborni]